VIGVRSISNWRGAELAVAADEREIATTRFIRQKKKKKQSVKGKAG